MWQKTEGRKLQLEVEKKARKNEGLKELDKALQDLHTSRQQYHGGSFVGNHIHKMLQVWECQ